MEVIKKKTEINFDTIEELCEHLTKNSSEIEKYSYVELKIYKKTIPNGTFTGKKVRNLIAEMG